MVAGGNYEVALEVCWNKFLKAADEHLPDSTPPGVFIPKKCHTGVKYFVVVNYCIFNNPR